MIRPKWARELTTAQWKHLQECQGSRRPTLAALRSDVDHQKSGGMDCWDCRASLATAGGTEDK